MNNSCRNCHTVWPDDYRGQCTACGAAISGWESSVLVSSGDMNSALNKARSDARRNLSFAEDKTGNASNPAVNHIKGTADAYAPAVVDDILEGFGEKGG